VVRRRVREVRRLRRRFQMLSMCNVNSHLLCAYLSPS
jgi:hypothetical protein